MDMERKKQPVYCTRECLKGGEIMRYYSVAFDMSAEKIKENAKINLREYAWDNPLAALNGYVYKTLINGLCFFVYREEVGEVTFAAFSYDERKYTYSESYERVSAMLHDRFCVSKIKEESCELTMYQFLECLLEAKRRDYTTGQ